MVFFTRLSGRERPCKAPVASNAPVRSPVDFGCFSYNSALITSEVQLFPMVRAGGHGFLRSTIPYIMSSSFLDPVELAQPWPVATQQPSCSLIVQAQK